MTFRSGSVSVWTSSMTSPATIAPSEDAVLEQGSVSQGVTVIERLTARYESRKGGCIPVCEKPPCVKALRRGYFRPRRKNLAHTQPHLHQGFAHRSHANRVCSAPWRANRARALFFRDHRGSVQHVDALDPQGDFAVALAVICLQHVRIDPSWVGVGAWRGPGAMRISPSDMLRPWAPIGRHHMSGLGHQSQAFARSAVRRDWLK